MAYPISDWSDSWDEGLPPSSVLAGLWYQYYQWLKRDLRERYELTEWPWSEKIITIAYSSGTLDIDCALGNVFKVTLGANVSATTFSSPPPNTHQGLITLHLIQDGTGTRTMSWPSSVKWPYSVVPTLDTTLSTKSILTFVTIDGGTTWAGSLVGTKIPLS